MPRREAIATGDHVGVCVEVGEVLLYEIIRGVEDNSLSTRFFGLMSAHLMQVFGQLDNSFTIGYDCVLLIVFFLQ